MHDYACHSFFGIGFTLLAFVLLFGVLRHHRYHHAYGYCGFYGPPGPLGHHGGYARRFRGGMLRRVFEHLDTSPGQEKAIRAIIDDLRARMRTGKSAGGPELLQTFRAEVVQAYERALETLDDKQRQQLADLIAKRF